MSANNVNSSSSWGVPLGKKHYRIALIIIAVVGLLLALAGAGRAFYSMGHYAGVAASIHQNDELRTAFANTAAELTAARDQIKALNDSIRNKDHIIGELQSQADTSRQEKCRYLQDQINQGKLEADQIFKNPESSVSYEVFTLSSDQKKKVEIINERINNFIRSMSTCK